MGANLSSNAGRCVRAMVLAAVTALAACGGGNDAPPGLLDVHGEAASAAETAAGRPSFAGRPEDRGRPHPPGRPDDPGRPAFAQRPDDRGRPGGTAQQPPAGVPPAGPTYRLVDIGTLPGMTDMTATSIHRSGLVVGYGSVGGADRAFLWDGDRLHDLGTLAGTGTRATAVSGDGTVVGASSSGAFIWRPGTGMQPFPGADSVDAVLTTINDSGLAGGFHSHGYASLWRLDGERLTYPGMERHQRVRDINDAGVAVGEAFTMPQGDLPTRWTQDAGHSLLGPRPTIPGCSLPDSSAVHCLSGEAVAINEAGQVAGTLRITVGVEGVATPAPDYAHLPSRAFRWTPDGGMTLLGWLPDGPDSSARGIDESGRVYGSLGGFAATWTGEVATRLDALVSPSDPLGWIHLQEAIGSDDSGGIAVNAHVPGSGQRVVMLVPDH
jgi:probable HAF family extracellular repeat protein